MHNIKNCGSGGWVEVSSKSSKKPQILSSKIGVIMKIWRVLLKIWVFLISNPLKKPQFFTWDRIPVSKNRWKLSLVGGQTLRSAFDCRPMNSCSTIDHDNFTGTDKICGLKVLCVLIRRRKKKTIQKGVHIFKWCLCATVYGYTCSPNVF